jgi:hypothetical protein
MIRQPLEEVAQEHQEQDIQAPRVLQGVVQDLQDTQDTQELRVFLVMPLILELLDHQVIQEPLDQ